MSADPAPSRAEERSLADQYAAIRSAIAPSDEEERWQEIPWGVSLWEARERAAREGRPILLWEMDGHPLGCT